MRVRTPQEKKALSYAKDFRNSYHANDKASRKRIPLRKAGVKRDYRRKINEILSVTKMSDSEQIDVIDSRAKNVRRTYWKKCSDTPLREFVERKLGRREAHAGHGKTSRKKTTIYLKTLKFETKQADDSRWVAEVIGSNGIVRYGESREDAIDNCKSLARVLFLERLGAIDKLSITDRRISYRSK